MKNIGETFLHQRDSGLHSTEAVEHTVSYLRQNHEKIPNQPSEKIAAYLGFLADREYVNDGILTGDPDSIERQVGARIIKADDVPEAYFQLQQRIARQQGHGDIDITEAMRGQMIEAIQTDQKASLEQWAEYVAGDGNYPNWFRYYAWESVTKLGQFNKEKGEFSKRSKGTTAQYPELNREALAYVLDVITKHRLNGEANDDENLAKLLQGANFGKLYARAILEVTPDDPELRKSMDGQWVRFDQTTDPRIARRLSESLQGHGTGWCTAGESTASTQLNAGDFYVWYSKDAKDEYSIPRLAIRMEGGQVSYDVRGVLPGQEVEPGLVGILSDKLQTLPGGEAYVKKASDMKKLTAIEDKLKADARASLSKDDIKFLYELEDTIEGFGYQSDPRIAEIKASRENKDVAVLKELAIERIKEGFDTSFQAYSQVSEILQAKKLSKEEMQKIYEAKLLEWQQRGVLDYVGERMATHGEVFMPVITPEGLFDSQQITQLATEFGKDQPHETYIYNELYRQCSAEELCGAGGLAISLLPNKPTDELGYNTVQKQQDILQELQTSNPEIGYKVPSVLINITRWFTLRSRNQKLQGGNVFDETYVRHFDIKLKMSGDRLLVPNSFLDGVGKPFLGLSVAVGEGNAVLSVG